jgi:hypothetical protein
MDEVKEEVIEGVVDVEVASLPSKPKCNICGSEEKLYIAPMSRVRCHKHYVLTEYIDE